ncbi:hypothetical protein LE181_15930 [Streptomyces sp. SCA3-4]|uniref:hypothetical protein n=1 Tax=Streptomyces sichuanensis TaxID=2871810 RepID=UPI001CE287C8|nr:hypothetical protein [Streptomyces sichuanensis]MCA6093643.1 hypothetical protein [Streptomyces sichuanensis]
MAKETWGRTAYVAGPVCMGVYGLIRLIDEEHGPGPAWTLGHLALLAGVVLFVPVFLGLDARAAHGGGAGRRWFAATGLLLGLLGVAAVTVQAGIDVLVGAHAEDRATMDALFERIQSHAGVKPAFYTVGPLLFYVGLVLLVGQLAVQRMTAAWRPPAVVAGVAVTAASLDLIPVGALMFLLALAPLRDTPEDGASGGDTSGRGALRAAQPTPRRTV